MISLIIILEVIFLSISGIYYMSLMAYKGQDQFHKKKVVLAVVMFGCSMPGVLTCVTGDLQEKEWGTGFLTCSLTLLGIAVVWLLFLLRERLRNRLLWEEEGKVSIREEVFQADSVKEPVTRKQILCLVVLTFVYGILIFYRLGSRQTPQTSLELSADGIKDEIVLDLGEEKDVGSVQIYLGHMVDRLVAVSYYDTEQKQWVPLEEEVTMESNYCWNTLEIHHKLRYLGLVSRNASASYQEMVITGEDGEHLLPVNAEDYPALFDEQELFPEEMTYYDTTMFDEVYYAGSAYEFLQGMQMYEITHPPMGKILIAIGERLFGVTPFGWRFVSALAGVLLVPLFFWFLYLVTTNGTVALIGTALLSMDFMHFTLSRIATLDSLAAFFILLMITLLIYGLKLADRELAEGRKVPSMKLVVWMILDGLAVGMGVSTKWTGFYAMLAMAVCFLFSIGYWFWKQNKGGKPVRYVITLFIEGLGIYSLLPLGVYLLSFVPQMKAEGAKNLWKVMWNGSLYMLNFHSEIVFEHPYESPWYTWPLDLVPLMDAGDFIGEDKVSLIATFGNPLIWWAGVAAFFYLICRIARKKDKLAGVLCFFYLMMLAPWFFIKRTVFIYQYYASSIFLYGMLGYTLWLIGKKKRQVIPVFLEAAFFLFLMFFPVISGMTVKVSHITSYLQWFETWQFVIMGGGT